MADVDDGKRDEILRLLQGLGERMVRVETKIDTLSSEDAKHSTLNDRVIQLETSARMTDDYKRQQATWNRWLIGIVIGTLVTLTVGTMGLLSVILSHLWH